MSTSQFRGQKPIDALYQKLSTLYANRWEAQFRSEHQVDLWKECWAEELDELEVTFDEVKQGLKRCLELYDWPPSFPEFLKACRPALDYEACFYEAVEQMRFRADGKDKWSSPAVYWAAVKLGNDMSSDIYLNLKKRWKTALDQVINDIAAGVLPNEVPVRPKLVEPPKRASGKEYSQAATCHLSLAKEILEREPAWKTRLREKGGNPDAGGMKSIGECLAAEILVKD